MESATSVSRPGTVADEGRRAVLRYAAAWLAGALPAFLVITLLWLYPGRTTPFGDAALGALALSFPVMVRRLRVPRRVEFVYFLLVAGVAFGVISILTGWGNGLTDEPFTTPRFASFVLSGHDPYTTQLVFTYQQYGRTLLSRSYYLYLPLLMFLQIPGVDYKWFALGCWALVLLLVRRRFDTASLLAQPYVMLVAASGYNDLPVLLLLTLGFVGWEGRRQKWAEYLSLGCKQFANAFVIAYYLVQRRWRDTLVTLGVSAAFVVPFFVWGGPTILCPAVFANRLPSCPSGSSAGLLLNYPVWAVWLVAVFYLPVLAAIRAWSSRPVNAGRWVGWRRNASRLARLPAVTVVGASAILVGLCGFVLTVVAVGATPAGAVGGGTVALALALAWTLGWNGPWASAPESPGLPGRNGRRLVVAELATVAIGLPTLAGWIAAGGPAFPGVSLGLTLGVSASTALLLFWGLGAETPGPGSSSRPNPS